MEKKEIDLLTSILAQLLLDRAEVLRKVDDLEEQISLTSDLIRRSVAAYKAEHGDEEVDDDEDEDDDEDFKDLGGILKSMKKEFANFCSQIYKECIEEEDTDHDQD